MRTGQPIIGRPAWYDRNPSHILNSYDVSSVSPHTDTQRWTYTVPSGRKAMVEVLCARAIRDAAASTVDEVWLWISLTPSGGSVTTLMKDRLLTNNVGDRIALDLGQSMILLPGDKISAYTMDTSTGGAVHYSISAKITEFDA